MVVSSNFSDPGTVPVSSTARAETAQGSCATTQTVMTH